MKNVLLGFALCFMMVVAFLFRFKKLLAFMINASAVKFFDQEIKKPLTTFNPIFETRQNAVDVLTDLTNLIEAYGYATLADLYDLTGTDSSYTDAHYVWRDLSAAKVKKMANNYILEMPEPIDNYSNTRYPIDYGRMHRKNRSQSRWVNYRA